MRVNILDIPIDIVTLRGALAKMEGFFRSGGQAHVATPNPEMIVESLKNSEFRYVLQNTNLNLPDGIGLVLAMRVAMRGERKTGAKVGSRDEKLKAVRVTGTDILQSFCERTAERVFLLGAAPGVAEDAARMLKKRNHALRVVGTYAGSPCRCEEAGIVARINKASPTMLFVAYGAPSQDIWIARNLKKIPSVKVAMGIGGALDFVSRKKTRAPVLLRKSGFEWLWRLMLEPRRIMRIWRAAAVFPVVFLSSLCLSRKLKA